MSDPQSILDPEYVDITLGGKVYRWKMPSARDVREWGSALASIEGILERDPSALFSCCNRILDFFYANNREMAKDRKTLDDARVPEVFRAKKELSDFISPLLMRQTEGLAELSEELLAKRNSAEEKSQPSNS